jgi:hypothetical protein
MTSRLGVVAGLVVAGCTAGAPQDRVNDNFLAGGKADGIDITPAETAGILEVVNAADLATLRDDIGLTDRSARNVIAYRAGDDGVLATKDDVVFATLVELDDVPYIGKYAFTALLSYVQANITGTASFNEGGMRVPLPRACAMGESALAGCHLPVPVIRQLRDYTCGDVALLSILRYWDAAEFAAVAERDLIAPLGTTSDNGTEPDHIAAFADRVARLHAVKRENVSAQDLDDALRAGQPVITDIEAWQEHPTFGEYVHWDTDYDDGHYVVLVGAGRAMTDAPHVRRPWLAQPDVCGADAKCVQDVYLFMDPSTTGYYTYIPRDELVSRWHDTELDANGTAQPVSHLAIFITPDPGVVPTPYDVSSRHEANASSASALN